MITEKIQIEFARFDDAIAISRLSKNDIEQGLGWRYQAPAIARIIRNKSKNVVVARIDEVLAGFGIMSYSEHQANLDLLAVERSFRRSGIGTRIVTWLEAVALTGGAFNVFVQARETNLAAIRFYETLGYQELDRLEGWYQGVENGVVMAKSLRPMHRAN